MYIQDICLIKVMYWSRAIHYMNKSINKSNYSETALVIVQSFYEQKNAETQMVYTCSSSNGHQTSSHS